MTPDDDAAGSALDAAAPVASPCTGVCRIDASSGFCAGCGRKLDEIAAWSQLDEGGKRAVLDRLAQRDSLPVAPPPYG